ncbi:MULTISPECIES: hypothetical protein [Bacillus cereus group]|nr:MULTISPECIES: hypothetical protein [Bacillus cereus group]
MSELNGRMQKAINNPQWKLNTSKRTTLVTGRSFVVCNSKYRENI